MILGSVSCLIYGICVVFFVFCCLRTVSVQAVLVLFHIHRSCPCRPCLIMLSSGDRILSSLRLCRLNTSYLNFRLWFFVMDRVRVGRACVFSFSYICVNASHGPCSCRLCLSPSVCILLCPSEAAYWCSARSCLMVGRLPLTHMSTRSASCRHPSVLHHLPVSVFL